MWLGVRWAVGNGLGLCFGDVTERVLDIRHSHFNYPFGNNISLNQEDVSSRSLGGVSPSSDEISHVFVSEIAGQI